MNQYRESKDYVPFFVGRNSLVDVTEGRGKVYGVLRAVLRSGLMLMLAAAVVAAVELITHASAQANSQPPLTLTLTGPHTAGVDTPLDGINVRLINSGLAVRDSRLRLLIHDEMNREVLANDIKIDVLEGGDWKPVQIETIDGGVMGAIGTAGQPHKELHKRGGFAIGNKADKSWRLRVTFHWNGRYSIVATVSPDNGATQLAQPAGLNVEVL
jgi:hypothetical protein